MRVVSIGLGLLSMGLAAVGLAQPRPGLVPLEPIGMGPQIIDLRLVGREAPIPRNGSLLIFARFDGLPPEEQTPLIQVSKASGADTVTFGGELRELGSFYYSWTATEPLEVGTYQLSLAHSAFGSMLETVTVVADVVLEPPAFASNPIAGYGNMVSEYAVCEVWTGIELVPGTPFATREKGHAKVFANLTLSGEPVNNNQFLYRAVVPGVAEMTLSPANAAVVAEPFTEQAAEYCFGIEAVSITTGMAHPYPDIELCAPHGDIGDFVERDVIVSIDTFNRFVCTVPPAGFEAQWCEINVDCIDVWRFPENTASDNCQTYFDTCPDAERPDAGPRGTTMDAGTAGTDGGRRDAGFAPVFEPEDAAVESDASDDERAAGNGSGCAIARRVSTLHASPVACAALAMLALLRVRRRRFAAAARD